VERKYGEERKGGGGNVTFPFAWTFNARNRTEDNLLEGSKRGKRGGGSGFEN